MTALFRGPITGPKAFGIFSSFFVVIIAVNIVLAVQAVRTFPGLEVKNSYVASQSFEAERQAQEALGWTAAARIADGELILTVDGRDGRPVANAEVAAVLGRATVRDADQELVFLFNGVDWRAPVAVGPGQWHLALDLRAVDGTPFRQRLDLMVE
jgi:nitrogen fixation protein FixH